MSRWPNFTTDVTLSQSSLSLGGGVNIALDASDSEWALPNDWLAQANWLHPWWQRLPKTIAITVSSGLLRYRLRSREAALPESSAVESPGSLHALADDLQIGPGYTPWRLAWRDRTRIIDVAIPNWVQTLCDALSAHATIRAVRPQWSVDWNRWRSHIPQNAWIIQPDDQQVIIARSYSGKLDSLIQRWTTDLAGERLAELIEQCETRTAPHRASQVFWLSERPAPGIPGFEVFSPVECR